MRDVTCPSCRRKYLIEENPKIGEYKTCAFCGVTGIIVWLNPLELDLFYEGDYVDNEYSEDYQDR